ncbi:hypothetical protein BS50DRAFT_122912 [Corynespora cassiicola Philippines]|uniref:Uncharacterized protein n=1 Tax=Corynespora cassiicola Philippines TaxID=1448308 RepID=A0A2T2NAV2_CORCC|nr:hypothetical protein BS50DRAFT_122912 [Corynespora cassiicola Philippines]
MPRTYPSMFELIHAHERTRNEQSRTSNTMSVFIQVTAHTLVTSMCHARHPGAKNRQGTLLSLGSHGRKTVPRFRRYSRDATAVLLEAHSLSIRNEGSSEALASRLMSCLCLSRFPGVAAYLAHLRPRNHYKAAKGAFVQITQSHNSPTNMQLRSQVRQLRKIFELIDTRFTDLTCLVIHRFLGRLIRFREKHRE